MKKDKYYRIAIKTISQEITDKYDLNNKQINRYIYVWPEKGMYVLVQAGIISHKALK